MSNDLSKLTKEELIELKNKIKNDDNKFISDELDLSKLDLPDLKKVEDSFMSDELDLSKLNFPELDSKSPEIKR